MIMAGVLMAFKGGARGENPLLPSTWTGRYAGRPGIACHLSLNQPLPIHATSIFLGRG